MTKTNEKNTTLHSQSRREVSLHFKLYRWLTNYMEQKSSWKFVVFCVAVLIPMFQRTMLSPSSWFTWSTAL